MPCKYSLTCGWVTYMCQWTNQHWFRQWLVAWPAPIHYLKPMLQYFLIGLIRTHFSEILIEILTFSLKNAFKCVVCEMAAMLSWPQCVNTHCCAIFFQCTDNIQISLHFCFHILCNKHILQSLLISIIFAYYRERSTLNWWPLKIHLDRITDIYTIFN